MENRGWKPPPALFGKWVGIHAGKEFDHEGLPYFMDALRSTGRKLDIRLEDMAHGSIVGCAVLTGVVDRSASKWFSGPYGWQLEQAVAIDPLPCKGALGLWTLPDELMFELRQRAWAGRTMKELWGEV